LLGKSDQVILEARESIRLIPQFAAPYWYLAKALLRLNRLAEATDVLTQALEQKLDMTRFHSIRYQIAFIHGDTSEMQQQIDWARGKPDEYVAFDWQVGSAAFAGQWRKAQEFSRRTIDLAAGAEMTEVAAGYATEQALRAAVFGDCRRATEAAAEGLALKRGRATLPRAALALALCGGMDQVKPLLDELTKRYPEDTLLSSIWLPVVRAALEFTTRQRDAGDRAIGDVPLRSRC
jgi:hypothetical protein